MLACAALISPVEAHAHTSEQGYVLLLPTGLYITTGVTCVTLTLLLLMLLPTRITHWVFRPIKVMQIYDLPLRHLTSCLSALFLAFLIWRGLTGTSDPLDNPLPLFIWTVWWVILISLQGLIGNIWRWANPWTGPAFILAYITQSRAPFRYPRKLGHAPAIVGFMLFGGFLLADPAPSDPTRLARILGGYWYFTMTGICLFGPRWLSQAEPITLLMRSYSGISLFNFTKRGVFLGVPGWKLLRRKPSKPGLAIFALLLLGTGTFDGLNETFWWLGILGINPLEFPGRSAVITQTITGLIVVNLTLIMTCALCLYTGDKLCHLTRPLRVSFCLYAPTILPIALGYHIAHYLTSVMVSGQYVLKSMTDPMGNGADILRLGSYYVTTGFFNTPDTVRIIWLTQAGAVVAGHVVAILLSHALALKDHNSHRSAILGQLPLTLFMIGYTMLGLWILASPRGL